MPKGVEHSATFDPDTKQLTVSSSVMPKGVEHLLNLAREGDGAWCRVQ